MPALRGRTVVNLFYEASTRTSSSFELAAKRLSADVVSIRSVGSSVDKGESLKDTVQTLSAYDPAAIVIRSPHVGAAQLVAGWTTAWVINAGDGKHEHPTQALLDVFTLRRRLSHRRPEHLDHRRRHALARRPLEHPRVQSDGRERDGVRSADADPARDRRARMQLGDDARRPPRGGRRLRAADAARADARVLRAVLARIRDPLPDHGRAPAPRSLLMHPGPVNRGVELSADAIDSPQALIGERVKAGVAVRMAVLYELLVGSPILQAVA